MAIPLKKHPGWAEIIEAVLFLVLITLCVAGFLLIG
jgi:hypothetical protein